jgi:hypothetical protein
MQAKNNHILKLKGNRRLSDEADAAERPARKVVRIIKAFWKRLRLRGSAAHFERAAVARFIGRD